MNKKRIHKETKNERLERIHMSGTVQTRIVPDKTKYTRKIKHKDK